MKRALHWFRVLLFYLLDKLAVVGANADKNTSLVLVKLDAIGDFILWLDTAKEYSRIFPGRRIELIANAAWADLAANFPYWGKVWSIDVQRFSSSPVYRWQTVRIVRKAGFEIAIQPTYSRAFMHGDSIVRATGAVQRIGSVGDYSNIRRGLKVVSDTWYTALISATEHPLMELYRNAEFLSNLSGKVHEAELSKLVTSAIQALHLKVKNDYFIVFPGASWHGRQWPIAHFVEFLDKLHQTYGWQPIVCGGEADRVLCQTIVNKSTTSVLNLAGKTSLAELAELIRSAKILIGNETSAVHIAAAVATPSICVLGGGHYGRFMPYPDKIVGIKPSPAIRKMDCFNCNWNCSQAHDPSGPVPCIAQISVEQVLVLADQAIQSAYFHE